MRHHNYSLTNLGTYAVVLAYLLLSTCKKHSTLPEIPQPNPGLEKENTRVFINESDPRLLELTRDNFTYTFIGTKDATTKKANLSEVIVTNINNTKQSDTITFDPRGRISSYFGANGERGQFLYDAQDSVSLVFNGKDSTVLINLKTVSKGLMSNSEAKRVYAAIPEKRMARIKVVKQFQFGKEAPIADATVFTSLYYKTSTIKATAINLGDGFYGAVIPENVAIKDPKLIESIIDNITSTLDILCTKVGGFKIAGSLAIGCAVVTAPSGPGVGICGLFLELDKFCDIKEKFKGMDNLLIERIKDRIDEYYDLSSATLQVYCTHPLEGDMAIPPFSVNVISSRPDANGSDAKIIYRYGIEGTWKLINYPVGSRSNDGQMSFGKNATVHWDAISYLGEWRIVDDKVYVTFGGQRGDIILYAPNYNGRMLSGKFIHGSFTSNTGAYGTFTLKKIN